MGAYLFSTTSFPLVVLQDTYLFSTKRLVQLGSSLVVL